MHASFTSRLRTRLAGPQGVLVVANVGSQIINFACGVLMARSMGPDGRGQVSLATTYDEVSTNVLSLGVPAAGAYEHKARERRDELIVGAALRIAVVSLPLTAALAWVVAVTVFADYGRGIQTVVLLAIGATPFANTFLITARMLLAAQGRLRALSTILPAQMIVRATMLTCLWALDAMTPGWVAGALVASGWTANALAFVTLGVVPRRGGPVRPMLAYGLRTVPAAIANMANSRLDQLLIAPLISTAVLGHYAVAVGLTFLPVNVGSSLALGGYRSYGTDRAERRAVKQASGLLVGSAALTALGVIVFTVPVYGDEFEAAIAPALWLLPGAIATGLTSVYGQIANARGVPGINSWAQSAGLVATVVGLSLVLPDGGIVGAAIVSSAAYTLRLAVCITLLARRQGGHHAPGSANALASEDDHARRV